MENRGIPSASARDWPWMDVSLSPDARANLLLAQLTLEEKISLLHEQRDGAMAVFRLRIPALRLADGPAGIRLDVQSGDGGKATSPPAPIALAATWDGEAAEQYGDLVGREASATGHNVLLGPGLDIARIPSFGRLFESFGEDPRLAGQMAARFIQVVQRHHVIATAKHFTVNAQEEHRHEVDVHLDERTLREIYTLPFAVAIQDGNVGAVMGAYNRVNGTYCCEHQHLLTEILKQQCGFTGWVMSDFGAVHSTIEAANAGLDWELGLVRFFGDALLEAIETGRVDMATLDDKVRRQLSTMFAIGLFDHPVQVSPLPVREHGQRARKIAGKGIVLLKNDAGLLPLSSGEIHSIAVIGADADGYITGGGSSYVRPTYLVSIVEGIRQLAGERVQVVSAEGVDPVSAADLLPGAPSVPSSVLTPPDPGAFLHGLQAEYWTNTRFEGEPALVRTDRQAGLNLGFFNFGGMNASSLPPTPEDLNHAMSARWTGSITVPTSGDYTLSLTHLGTARLYLDGRLLIDDPGIRLSTHTVALSLAAFQSHLLRIDYAADRPEQSHPAPGNPGALLGAQVRLGWEHPADTIPATMLAAADIARRADIALVVARDYRNEHADLPGLTLPNEQDLLIQRVAAANSRTIVALATGGPVLMPWLEQVPAVLECWYGGQELGSALADILFGAVTPSGKLPVTFPRSESETPVSSPEHASGAENAAHLSEGLGVGYRGYDAFDIEPLFPFGYGLSYTRFAYSQFRVEPERTDGSVPIQVRFIITNSGSRPGAEVAQVYLGLPASAGEPPKRLVGWAQVELMPGEKKNVVVVIEPDTAWQPISSWDSSANRWEKVYGAYQVFVGASSRDVYLTGNFTIQRTLRE